MHPRIAGICLAVFYVLLALSGFLLSSPGDSLLWFAIMSVFALVASLVGSRLQRLVGLIGFALAVVLIGFDYKAGVEFRQRQAEKMRSQSLRGGKDGEPVGPANGSQPIHSELKSTAPTAGSRR